jgi:hypothetical protein
MLSPEEHLKRMSGILRRQIGPAVADPFPRTQAFMAAVVLEKLARQLAARSVHAEADTREVLELRTSLRAELGPEDPGPVVRAVEALDPQAVGPSLSGLVAALYSARSELGPDRFEHLLGRVRPTLRARLDRQLEYSA